MQAYQIQDKYPTTYPYSWEYIFQMNNTIFPQKTPQFEVSRVE
jgi:hypothetical protein